MNMLKLIGRFQKFFWRTPKKTKLGQENDDDDDVKNVKVYTFLFLIVNVKVATAFLLLICQVFCFRSEEAQ